MGARRESVTPSSPGTIPSSRLEVSRESMSVFSATRLNDLERKSSSERHQRGAQRHVADACADRIGVNQSAGSKEQSADSRHRNPRKHEYLQQEECDGDDHEEGDDERFEYHVVLSITVCFLNI